MTGTPVLGKKRLQFNLPMFPIPKIEVMKDSHDALVPLLWVEEVSAFLISAELLTSS